MAKKKSADRVKDIGDASYAVLDAEGKLIAGHNVHARQDQASTTKMHTLYVLGALDKEGKLPKDFWEKHDGDIQRMMVRSDNAITRRVARSAMGSEGAFIERMNTEAERMGLANTHFSTVDGWPKLDHYSTAHDMALMAHRFKKDFPKLADEYASIERRNTAGPLTKELDGVKTGTATGFHGGTGRHSIVGFTEDGTISVASAESKGLRNDIMRTALGELDAGREAELKQRMEARYRGKPLPESGPAAPTIASAVSAFASLSPDPVKPGLLPPGFTSSAALSPAAPEKAQSQAAAKPAVDHLPAPKGFYFANRNFDIDKHANAGRTGESSFYDKGFHGKRTAGGMQYDRDQYTVAVPQGDKHLLGSVVTITDPKSGKEVNALVTDTGSFGKKYDRILDMSRKLAQEFGSEHKGVKELQWKVNPEATAAYREKHGMPYTYASRNAEQPAVAAAASAAPKGETPATLPMAVAALDTAPSGLRAPTDRSILNNTLDVLGIKREIDVSILRKNVTGKPEADAKEFQAALREDVRTIQNDLSKAGIAFGRVDGLLGERTENAIKQYTAKHGKEPEALTRLRAKSQPDEKAVAAAIRPSESADKQAADSVATPLIVVAEHARQQREAVERQQVENVGRRPADQLDREQAAQEKARTAGLEQSGASHPKEASAAEDKTPNVQIARNKEREAAVSGR